MSSRTEDLDVAPAESFPGLFTSLVEGWASCGRASALYILLGHSFPEIRPLMSEGIAQEMIASAVPARETLTSFSIIKN